MFPRLLTFVGLVLSVVGASANTFVVSNTNDAGPGSLRQAIIDANNHPNPGIPDIINFSIPGNGVHTISVASELPGITGGVIMDGWSQPGFQNAPLIEITSAAGLSADGLHFFTDADRTTVRGLIINGFKKAIYLDKCSDNTIQGCYLGTNATATQSLPNDVGIQSLFSSHNQIGGIAAVERNIISGNRFFGINLDDDLSSTQTSGHIIQGNHIGTDITGTQALPNGSPTSGIGLRVVSHSSTIGGAEPGAGNLVSGNIGDGIYAVGSGIVVIGNRIGTTASGAQALGNTGRGLYLSSLSGAIGGDAPGSGNLISGNSGVGATFDSSAGVIQGNLIGTDVSGQTALPNGSGLAVAGVGSLVGGNVPGSGNLISGNSGPGLFFFITRSPLLGNQILPLDNVIQGNFIGTDVTGTTALPNGGDGIVIPAYSNRIGGTTPGTGNLISGNGGNGISGTRGSTLKIQGNLIGTQVDGVSPLGNHGHGIAMQDAGCIIGSVTGADVDPANTIAFNLLNGIGVTVSNDPNVQARISANFIHDNGLLGIDLGDNGVTPNDPGDSDSGANGLQNFPVLASAFGFQGNLTIYGSLNSTPSKDFTLEFFANPAPDSSGFGEGEVFLGQAKVTTTDTGDVNFNVTFPLPANVVAVSATAIDSHGNTSEFSADANVSPSAPSPPPTNPTPVYLPTHSLHLVNLSTRLRVEAGDHALIAGFIVVGTEPKKVIIRGIGPSLSNLGVPGVLADPVLELHDASGTLLATNDNWRSSQQSEIQMTGVAPTSDAESAIVATLTPGSYTTILRGKDDATGVGLVEVYDLARGAVSHLGNVSTRGFVGTGDNVMIGGVIVGDNGGGTIVVVRAIGPSLSHANIADAMTDPILDLHNANGALIDSNDDWQSGIGADAVADSHLGPRDERESALYKSLAPGNYTAIVRGKNNSVGVALVEVYDLGPQ